MSSDQTTILPMATEKPSPAVEKMTVKLFKTWMRGIEMMQKDDWRPNAQQWKLIREAIENLVEEPERQQAPPTITYPVGVREFAPTPALVPMMEGEIWSGIPTTGLLTTTPLPGSSSDDTSTPIQFNGKIGTA